MKSHRKRITKKIQTGTAHFRLLGLRRGECRVNVIRSAAQAMSIALTHSESIVQPTVADNRRASIAFATYQLLDPRKRVDLLERVQLAYPIDREDMEIPAIAVNALIDRMPPLSRRTLLRTDPASPLKLMGQPVMDEAIDLELPGNASVNELSLDERRSLVRLLKESNEGLLRGLSPLGWIRSRLGI
jgi:hypothetical protein